MERAKRTKRINLPSFPQYVSKVRSKMTELKLQSLANARKYDLAPDTQSKQKSRRGRSQRMPFSCFDSEVSPSFRKSLPKTLSPLNPKPYHGGSRATIGLRLDTAEIGSGHPIAKNEHTHCAARNIFMHSWSNKKPLLVVVPKGPPLPFPLQALPRVTVRSLSSASSSGSNSPLSKALHSPVKLSDYCSKTSISRSISLHKKSPSVRKKSADHLATQNPLQLTISEHYLRKTSSLPQLVHKAPNPKAFSSLKAAPICSPYLMPVKKLRPEVRPVVIAASKSSPEKKKKPHHQKTLTKDKSGCSGTASSELMSIVSQSTWNQEDSVHTEESVCKENVCSSECEYPKCNVNTSSTLSMLAIPTITIRTATPIKTRQPELPL